MTKTATILAIGGFDPSGAAGVLLDFEVSRFTGCHCSAIISVHTQQTGTHFAQACPSDPKTFGETWDLLFSEYSFKAIKCGALGSASIVREIVSRTNNCKEIPLVLDPVIASTTAGNLIDDEGSDILVRELIPQSTLVTPNLSEAAYITGKRVSTISEMETAGYSIVEKGAQAALIKGGHLNSQHLVDVLITGRDSHHFHHPRQNFNSVRGTGCALSSLITSRIALGDSTIEAVSFSIKALQTAIEHSIIVSSGPRILRFM